MRCLSCGTHLTEGELTYQKDSRFCEPCNIEQDKKFDVLKETWQVLWRSLRMKRL